MVEPATTAIVVKAIGSIANSELVDSLRDGVVDFLTQQAKDLGKKEISNRISKLRSDAKLRQQIQDATERAAERWARDYPDRELVSAVAESTTFTDLPSVSKAMQTVAARPFDPIATETLSGRFNEVLPESFAAERVERGVIDLLELLREEFIGVPTLRETQAAAAAIQTARNTQEIPKQTEVLEEIKSILDRIESGPTPGEETLQDYLSWVIDQHRYLDPRGAMQTVRQVQVSLEDVFISLEAEAEAPLSDIDRRLYEHELETILAREDLSTEEKEDLRENLLAQFAIDKETVTDHESIELAELVGDHNKLVILGDPGAGKTTLLRYLALRHAQAKRMGQAQIADLGPTRFPLYTRIANFAEFGAGRSLGDYLPTCIRGEDHADPALAKLINNKIEGGECLVLLDGLDEVIEPDQRIEISDQINSFIRGHERSGNRFVVTSRVAGYRTAPLSGEIAHYRVRDMSDEQIQEFLEQWCSAVERFQTPDLSPSAQAEKAQIEIDGIAQAIESNPGVKRLATNPLLLRTLALIHRTGARLPQRRIELYKLAADTLIRDWELARGIPEAALVREADANRLLAELGAWMHEEKPAGIATEGEVRRKLADVYGTLQGKEADHPDVIHAVIDFLDKIRLHTGLFVERAPRRYGFMHLTFEEYFAARWLVAKPRTAAKRIRCKLHDSRWEEPILLAIGFYGMDFPDDVSDLIEEAILGKDLGGPSQYEDILHRDLLFAIYCLGDQDVSPRLQTQLIQEFVNLRFNLERNYKYQILNNRVTQIIKYIQGSAAAIEVNTLLLNALSDPNEDVRKRAVVALSDDTDQPVVVSALLTALNDPNENVRSSAAVALSDATNHPEVISALLTALNDPNENVRSNAAFAIQVASDQPEVFSALLNALKDPSENVRSSAALSLRSASDQPTVISALLTALKDPNEGVRLNTAGTLRGATDRPEVISALLDAFSDPVKYVRSNAAWAILGASDQPEVISALLNALSDPNQNVRSNAAWALRGASAQPEVTSALLNAISDPNEDVRSSAIDAIHGASDQPEVIPALLNAFSDPNEDVRSRAVEVLSDTSDQPDVILALLNALSDPNADVRSSAAWALSDACDQPDVISALLNALRDPNQNVRNNAAWALSGANDQLDVILALLNALSDPNEDVRSSAARSLSDACDQPEVISALLNALSDLNEDVRSSAAGALSGARDQPDVILALLNALGDPNEDVRSSAARALSGARDQPDVILALLNALGDPNEDVRSSAAGALAIIFRKSDANLVETYIDKLASILINLPKLDKYSYEIDGPPRDRLFKVLSAVAPLPRRKLEMD